MSPTPCGGQALEVILATCEGDKQPFPAGAPVGAKRIGFTASTVPFGKHILTPCPCQTHGNTVDADSENQASEQGAQRAGTDPQTRQVGRSRWCDQDGEALAGF